MRLLYSAWDNIKLSESVFDPDGPAVILGDCTSLFPLQLAQWFQERGMRVVVVSANREGPSELAPGIPVIRSGDFDPKWRRVARRIVRPALKRLENAAVRLYSNRYRRRTGSLHSPRPHEWPFVNRLWNAMPIARAALSLKPRFIFAQEASTYGLASLWCSAVPWITMPWGRDIYFDSETTPILGRAITRSLRRADLVVVGSATAAEYIVDRFRVESKKVHNIPGGVNLQRFRRSDSCQRQSICRDFGISPSATIVLSVRRFWPRWGSVEVLEAFMQLAPQLPEAHFILFGGSGTEANTRQARRMLDQASLSAQFTLFEGQIPIDECARVMSIADIVVSMHARGDLRSASVIQAAASGGAPVIVESPEFQRIVDDGFSAEFTCNSVESMVSAIGKLAENAALRSDMANKNRRYIAKHENYDIQISKLMHIINRVCDQYSDAYRPKHRHRAS